jgi:peptidase E
MRQRWRYIPTALIYEGCNEGQAKRMGEQIRRQFNIGQVAYLDPEHVKGEKLRSALERAGKIGVVYAEMGNTYALRHHLRESGGDKLVMELLDKGSIYVGSSAGSIVGGRTIQMAFWKNWDDKTAEGTISVDWNNPDLARGLDIGGGRSFFPHANGQYANKQWQQQQAAKHGHTDHEVITLADGQGYVIENGQGRYPEDAPGIWSGGRCAAM